MSAGMAGTIILGGERKSCEFLHRKCIDILADRNGFSRFSAVDLSDNTTFRNDYILDSQRIELRGNIFYCLILHTAVFRILVHMSSDPYHVVKIFLCLV